MRNIVSPLDGIRSPFGRRLGNVFSPLSLFASNEPGGWYDPSDLTTMFQDAVGTTAAALEQPVGLVLDKSKGLVRGVEMISNGDFSSGSTNWTLGTGVSVSSGAAVFTNVTHDTGLTQQSGNITGGGFITGRTYEVTFTILNYTSGDFYLVWPFNGGARSGANGSFRFIGVATDQRFAIRSWLSSCNFSIDNISVRELPGNHLSQSTSTARPVLSARVNLLVQTEDFLAAGWTKTAGTETINADNATAPNGTTTAERVTRSGTTWWHGVRRDVTVSTNTVYTLSLFVKAGTGDPGIVVAAGSTVDFGVKLNNGVPAVISDNGTSPVISYEAEPAGNGWYRLYASFNSSTATTIGVGTADGSAVNNAYNWYWGADLRPANIGVGLPAYQRVGAAVTGTSGTASPPVSPVTGVADYDASGFPYYLRFDGTDDFLLSGTIDPGSVDKAQVFAGVRKLSDAAAGCLTEFSANSNTNTGTFAMFAPSAAAANYFWRSYGNGSVGDVTVTTYAAPITNVLTGQGAIATDLSTLRVNGAQAGSSSADQGAGNFGSYPLYIGRRGGTSLPSNMSLYSLIVRFSATNLDAATISSTETWVNGKTKAYGPPVEIEILTRDGSTILTRDGSTVIGRAN